MKTLFTTLLVTSLVLGGTNCFAQDMGTGVNWDDLSPGSPLVVNENFQGFQFFHADENPDQGNSQHALADDGVTIIWGYKEMLTPVSILNGGRGATVDFDFYQCAFAPEWMAAWAYKSFINDGVGENTNRVTNGFFEISRLDNKYAAIPTVAGYLTVDLRPIEYVEMIQWTHSSTGGRKRGVMCEFSIDDGTTWDTLRYQPGEAWTTSFTKDVFSGEKTPNDYNCDPSAFGMTWADGIYAENVMLRFGTAGGQATRIHDLKVYGDIGTSVNDTKQDAIKVFCSKKQIHLSEEAKVEVYSLSGTLVRSGESTNHVSMDGFPEGIYFVKTFAANKQQVNKLLLK